MSNLTPYQIIERFIAEFSLKLSQKASEEVLDQFNLNSTVDLIRKVFEDEVKEFCKVFYLTKKQREEIKSAIKEGKHKREKSYINDFKFEGCKRGDIVSVFSEKKRYRNKYRNDCLFIYHGEKGFRDLSVEEDEYGHVPEDFLIEDFTPTYWKHIIKHNFIVWFSPSKHSYKNYVIIGENAIQVEEGDFRILFVYSKGKDPKKKFLHFKKKAPSVETCLCYYTISAVELIDVDEEELTSLVPDLKEGKYIVVLNNGKRREKEDNSSEDK